MLCVAMSELETGSKEWALSSAELSALISHDTPGMLTCVLDASPDCIKVLSLDGSLVFMNENGKSAMQIDDLADVLGAEWGAFWAEEYRPMVVHAVKSAAEGRPSRFEAPCATAKGVERVWDVSVAPVFDTHGQPCRLLAISRDVTERVVQAKALAEREAELERLTYRQARHVKELEEQIF